MKFHAYLNFDCSELLVNNLQNKLPMWIHNMSENENMWHLYICLFNWIDCSNETISIIYFQASVLLAFSNLNTLFRNIRNYMCIYSLAFLQKYIRTAILNFVINIDDVILKRRRADMLLKVCKIVNSEIRIKIYVCGKRRDLNRKVAIIMEIWNIKTILWVLFSK